MLQENVEIVRRLYEHWARGDYTFAESLDPQIEFSRSGTQVGGVDLEGQWRGLDAMWAATVEWRRAFDDLRTEAERIIDLGDDRVQGGQPRRRGRLPRGRLWAVHQIAETPASPPTAVASAARA